MNKEKLKPPFKVCGGKNSLHEWVIQRFPENYQEMVYIEPFCGTANVLIRKEPSLEEAINDTDTSVIKILKAIRDQHKELTDRLHKIKYTANNFYWAIEKKEFIDELDEVVNEFVARRMSKNGSKKTFAIGEQKKWLHAIEQVPIIAKRIENTYIFNKPAKEVLTAFNMTNALAYIDPPTPDETTEEEHQKLSDQLSAYKGKVIISSSSSIYCRLYKTWKCTKKKTKKTVEYIWTNY